MKRPICFLIVVLVVGLVGVQMAMADGPPVQWEKIFGGSDWEWARSVKQTTDGGYVIVGGAQPPEGGPESIYLIKTDSSGNQQWSKTFYEGNELKGYSVQQTSDGGYIIAGKAYPYGQCEDVYLLKTNDLGDEQWDKTLGGSRWDQGRSVQQTSDGGYIIAGYTDSYGAGSYDVYLIKTDSAANLQWQKTFGGSLIDLAHSVQQTSDGGYIIAGWTESFGAGGRDVYLIKTDSAGNMQWQKTFGGSDDDRAYSVQQTTDGGYIIAGYTDSYGAGSYDVYLIKTDSAANLQWQRTFGGSGNDHAYSVQQTTNGGYIIAGWTDSYGAGDYDVYLIKTDSAGNSEWQKTLGGFGYSVQQTRDGGYIIAGGYGSDFYLIKVAADGSFDRIKSIAQERLNLWRIFYNKDEPSDPNYNIITSTYWYNASEEMIEQTLQITEGYLDNIFQQQIGYVLPSPFAQMAAGGDLCVGLLGFYGLIQSLNYFVVGNSLGAGHIHSNLTTRISNLETAIEQEIAACDNYNIVELEAAREQEITQLENMLEQNGGTSIRTFGSESILAVNQQTSGTGLFYEESRKCVSSIVRSLYSWTRADMLYLVGATRLARYEVVSNPNWQITSVAPGECYDEEIASGLCSAYVAYVEDATGHIKKMDRDYPWDTSWSVQDLDEADFNSVQDILLAVGSADTDNDDELYALVRKSGGNQEVYLYDSEWNILTSQYEHFRLLITSFVGVTSPTCHKIVMGDPSNTGQEAVYVPLANCQIAEIYHNGIFWEAPIILFANNPPDNIASFAIGDGNPSDGERKHELYVATVNGHIYKSEWTGILHLWENETINANDPLSSVVDIAVQNTGEHAANFTTGVFVLTDTSLIRYKWVNPDWEKEIISSSINGGKSVIVTAGMVLVSSADGLTSFSRDTGGVWHNVRVGPTGYDQLVTRSLVRKNATNEMVSTDPSFVDGLYGFSSNGIVENVKPIINSGPIYVDDNGPTPYCGTQERPLRKIQDGIYGAVKGDTVIVADGTYTGDGNRDIDFLGKAITVRSENGPGNCIIDCQQQGRGFYFHNGEDKDSILNGFTITNGSTYDLGGGIYISSGRPTLINCIFSGNSALRGVYGYGGGMHNGGNPILINCTFTDNSVRTGGGGIHNAGSLTLINCTLSGNWGGYEGGGIKSSSDGSLMLTNCTFSGNSAYSGGGMFIEGDGVAVVTNCVFTQNSGVSGCAGVHNNSTTLTVNNCTFNANSASNEWGVVYNFDCSTTLTNCILWDVGVAEICGPSSITVNYSDVQGGWPSGEGNIDVHPFFANSDANDYHLLPDSPCINAGDPNADYSDQTDIDGNARVRYGRVDMGADEVFPIAGDFEPDEDVDWDDVNFFVSLWLSSCTAPGWCNSRDIDQSGMVDFVDYARFTKHWLMGTNP